MIETAPADSYSRSPSRLVERAAAVAATLLACAAFLVLLALFAARLVYGFDIEWMEGGTLVEAWRLRQGLALYAAPSADFIPFPYTPLQPWLIATLSRLAFIPVGYALGRGLSVAAFAAAAFAIWRAARREGAHRWEARAGVGVLAAGFAFTGGWFDLVRADGLYLALVTLAFALLRRSERGWRSSVAAATLLALAFFAKQTAAVFIVAGAVALLVVAARWLPLFAGTIGAVLGAGYALLQTTSGGWFRRYAFDVLGSHTQSRDVLLDRAWWHMAGALWPALVLAAGAWALALRRREARGLAFWTVFAAAGAVASALGASIQWSVANVYLPALYAVSILTAVAAATWRVSLPRSGARWGLGALAPLLLCAQIAVLRYDPRPYLPGENGDRAAAFLARVRALPGEILIPQHPFAAVQAGKPPGFHVMALGAAERGGLAVPQSLRDDLARQRWAALVLDRRPGNELDVYSSYKLAEILPAAERPRMLTGFAVEPLYWMVPKHGEEPLPGTVPMLDFENGSWSGWELRGDAFGPSPEGGPTRFQGPVGPFRGRYLANSGHPTIRATGRALSPEFRVPSPALRLLVGGAAGPRVAARLLIDGQPVRSASGSGSDMLSPVTWEVGDWVGRPARLELVDDDTEGYLLMDDLVALSASPLHSSVLGGPGALR